MKTLMLLALVGAITGCACVNPSPPVKVDSASALSPELVAAVTNALEHSPTYLDLKRRAKRPTVFIGEREDEWIWIDLYSEADDFFHRWATLKLATKTGRILKLGTDANLEDKWVVEFPAEN
jgi:hypothetical protein